MQECNQGRLYTHRSCSSRAVFFSACQTWAILATPGYGNAPSNSRGQDGAFLDCPCSPTNLTQTGDVPNGTVVVVDHCYTWDLIMDQSCRGPRPPKYCEASWCYVDAENCNTRREVHSSTYIQRASYSLATCGSLPVLDKQLFQGVQTRPFYINTMGSNLSTSAEATHPEHTAGHLAAIRLAAAIFNDWGVREHDIHYREITNESLAAFTGRYSACTLDVVLGHLDACISDYWDTAERRDIGGLFSGLLYNDMIYLYGQDTVAKQSFFEMLQKPLEPFSRELWLLVASVILCAGVALAFLESGAAYDGRCGCVQKYLDGSYQSVMGMLNGGLSFEPQTPGGKIFAVGFGLFVLILVASFTANTATFLIAHARAKTITDLNLALHNGDKVCVMPGMRSRAEAAYPAMKQLGVSTNDNGSNGPELLKAGACDVALLPEAIVRKWWSNGESCWLRRLGDALFSLPVGFFVHPTIAYAVTSEIATLRGGRRWNTVMADLSLISRCKRKDECIGGACQLDYTHMLGNCLLLGICFIFSLIVHYTYKGVTQSKTFANVEDEIEHKLAGGFEQIKIMIRGEVVEKFTSLKELQDCVTDIQQSIRRRDSLELRNANSAQSLQQTLDEPHPQGERPEALSNSCNQVVFM